MTSWRDLNEELDAKEAGVASSLVAGVGVFVGHVGEGDHAPGRDGDHSFGLVPSGVAERGAAEVQQLGLDFLEREPLLSGDQRPRVVLMQAHVIDDGEQHSEGLARAAPSAVQNVELAPVAENDVLEVGGLDVEFFHVSLS